ncbi:hypothetical protein PFISCL1PPCAC_26560 [Pristionchus fissidentatus]|uniref:SCP domain-containing protein n=1 Tax=Pristionchus fissidentatus TaxID=1538716 RepID=A0AAV5WYC4_9BILA|nr:hypothetical protein PFISCL1PPCAC_26560 [Pristionchus fissidentatus]
MIIRSALALLLIATTAHSQNPDAEVRLLAYDALRPDQYYRFQNAHYAFEVCICNRPARDPKLSRFCTCADLKGRTISEGAINMTERCLSEKPVDCLIAALPYFDREPPMYYVRVSANGWVLTQPGWQELTQGNDKTTVVSLPSSSNAPITLTFSITEHLQQWSNNRGAAKSATGENRPVVKQDKKTNKERPWFLMTSTTAPSWTRMRASTTTTTAAPTTTTAAARWNDWQTNEVTTNPTSSTPDYLRFINIANMYDLRNYLYMESLRDQIPAWRLDIQEYKNEIIAHHNAIRSLHGSPPLEYDGYLEGEAQRWASMLGARSSCIAHDPNRRHGECLFYFGGLTLPNARTLAALTVQSFYLERNFYDYDNYRPVFFYRTGHFTQLVWRASRRIGVGVHIQLASGGGAPCRPFSPTYQLYVVIKYDPPGNVQSAYAYRNNVSPRLY